MPPLERRPVEPSLAALQRGLAAAILERRDVASTGLAAGWACRLDVHRNNVYASLTEALRARFPVIERLVGAEFFAATARAFIAALPPRTPVLLEYGGGFPAFLADFAPTRPYPYLPDVARLEWLRNEAFHAADAAPLDPAGLAAVPPDRAGGLRFAPHPAARAFASPYPAVSIWDTNTHDTTVRAIAADGEEAVVVRPDDIVRIVSVPPGGAALLQALSAGGTLSDAAAAAPGIDLATALGVLLQAGAFAGFSIADA
ncbi:MAG: putative DNA-binding domain-containing protein [Rhodospirillales bacterium]